MRTRSAHRSARRRAALALATPASAAQDPTPMVVGGTTPPRPIVHGVAAVRGGHICGASLIKADGAVTAAHCVQGSQPGDLSVRVGSLEHASGGEEAGVSDIKVHDSADIAVIKLDTQVSAQPISIAPESAPPAPRPASSAGARPARSRREAPATLQELDTAIVDDADCSGIEGETEICTSNPVATPAPATATRAAADQGHRGLLGADRRHQPRGEQRLELRAGPSIYTDVSALSDWVEENTPPDRHPQTGRPPPGEGGRSTFSSGRRSGPGRGGPPGPGRPRGC
ncbi:S1 family peptidase [Saccharopolyspora gregorii]|uniref:Peptidase S1 domain-containing protein n=1 Tax=Saccharopolyspora gregorii TaxID=33914 RepID=A0ABP6RIH2_9PSEU